MNYHDERALKQVEATEPSTMILTGTEWLPKTEMSKKLDERIKDEMVCFLMCLLASSV